MVKNMKITKQQQAKMRKAVDRELAMNGPRIKGGAHKTSRKDHAEKVSNTLSIYEQEPMLDILEEWED